MHRWFAGLLAVGLAASLVAADKDDAKTDKTYKELRTEMLGKLGKAKTNDDRQEIFKQYAPQFLKFAQDNPKDESAFDALITVVQTNQGFAAKDTPAAKAIALLAKDYAKDERMGRYARTFASRLDDDSVKLLKAVIDNHPDKTVRARACAALVYGRERLVDQAEELKGDKELRAKYEAIYGKPYVNALVSDVAKFQKQIKEYGKLLDDKFEGVVPNLQIGKAMPELTSVDLDGKKVKLSDLRGKVVILDIWATWCGPCRAMIPHSREMVERLKDKPFVLVNISADAKKETLTKFLEKEEMPWTHWWNGDKGGIIEKLNVQYYPTIYVLDAKGVIRHKDIRDKKLEAAATKLIKELEASKKTS